MGGSCARFWPCPFSRGKKTDVGTIAVLSACHKGEVVRLVRDQSQRTYIIYGQLCTIHSALLSARQSYVSCHVMSLHVSSTRVVM